MSARRGEIVEFLEHGAPRLAVIIGGGRKLFVVDDAGDRQAIDRGRITVTIAEMPATTNVDDFPAILARLLDAEPADPELPRRAWEALADREEVDATEALDRIVGSIGDGATAAQRFATWSALRDDPIYFSVRAATLVRRDESAVEETLRARRERQRRHEVRRRFRERAAAALSGDAAFDLGPEFRELIAAFERVAVDPQAAPDDALDELAQDVLTSAGRPVPPEPSARALELLVGLGVLDEHENLDLHRLELDVPFSAAALEEARALSAAPPDDPPGTIDLTRRTTFTVDIARADELDDAFSVEPLDGGGLEVGVHVAHVPRWVPMGGALDAEARARGASLYLPRTTIPMLPDEIAKDAADLAVGARRLTLTLLARFDASARLTGTSIVFARVEVDESLTYGEANARISADSDDDAVADGLRRLHDCAQHLAELRAERGAIELPIPEVRFLVDEDDAGVRVERDDKRSAARVLTAELNIAFNAAIAEYCRQHELPVLYRRQETPRESELFDELGTHEDPLFLGFRLLRFMRPATNEAKPAPHAGLGLDAYVQASSPLRRYLDLLVHRQVGAHLLGEPVPYDRERFDELARVAEEAAAVRDRVARDARKYWSLQYLAERQGQELDAVVLEVEPRGVARSDVVLIDTLTRGSVDARSGLAEGDRVRVRIDRAEPRTDTLLLSLASRAG